MRLRDGRADDMTSRLRLETDAAPGPEMPAPAASTGIEPPVWLRVTAFVPRPQVLAFGSVGLVLAINGWYRPALAFPIGAVVWLALVALAWPAVTRDTPGRDRERPRSRSPCEAAKRRRATPTSTPSSGSGRSC